MQQQKSQNEKQGMTGALTVAERALPFLGLSGTFRRFVLKNWTWILGLLMAGVSFYAIYVVYFKSPAKLILTENKALPPSDLTADMAKNKASKLFDQLKKASPDLGKIKALLSGIGYNDFVKISNEFSRLEEKAKTFTRGGLFGILNKVMGEKEFSSLKKIIPTVITPDRHIAVGEKAAAKINGVKAYEVDRIDGIYQRGKLKEIYNAGETIGDVKKLIAEQNVAIVEKPWHFLGDLWIDTNEIEVKA